MSLSTCIREVSLSMSDLKQTITIAFMVSLILFRRLPRECLKIDHNCSLFPLSCSTLSSHCSWRRIVKYRTILMFNLLVLWKYNEISSKWPTWRTIPLFYNTFITVLYMFRATSCSSSGGQIVLIQHLVSSLSVSGRPVHRTATYREWRYQMLF